MKHLSRPNQFQQRHSDAFPTEASLRWFIFSNRQALEDSGAVIKYGRRLFIDEGKFFAVLEGQTGRAA